MGDLLPFSLIGSRFQRKAAYFIRGGDEVSERIVVVAKAIKKSTPHASSHAIALASLVAEFALPKGAHHAICARSV